MLGIEWVVCELSVGDLHTGLEYGIAWVGHEHRIAGIEQRQAQMPHALLRPVAARDHIGRDALHAEATLRNNRRPLA